MSHENVWLHNSVLLLLLAGAVYLYLNLPGSAAQAAGGGWETDGVLAMSVDANQRLILIDTTKKNICMYRTQGVGQFRLVCARSYRYDSDLKDNARLVEQGNGLSFQQVKSLKDQIEAQKGAHH